MNINVVGGLRPGQRTASNYAVELLTAALGGNVQPREQQCPPGTNLYIQHGWKLTRGLQDAMEFRHPYLIVDHGYFADREMTMSLSFNGFHGLSMPVDGIDKLPPRPHPPATPWRDSGERVYVYGQLTNDRACRGQSMEAWPTRTAQEAASAFGLPAVVRPHPKSLSSSLRAVQPGLSSTFDDSFCFVAWTSTASVQAILAGVPGVALHPANPAFPVCSSKLGLLVRPDRAAWLHDLSYRQYQFTEVNSAAKYIRLGYEQASEHARAGHYDTQGLRV